MADDFLTEMNLFYRVGKWLHDGGAAQIQARAFRPTGWIIPDDTDTGIAFGEGEELGAGYMEMDLRDVRQTDRRPLYELRGPYGEVGLGNLSGKLDPLKKDLDAIFKMLPPSLQRKVGSDFIKMPGGGIGPLMYGPADPIQRPIQASDFEFASWLYFHIGAELGLAIDGGLMFMLDKSLTIDLVMTLLAGNLGGALFVLMGHCKAWVPYWGSSVGLGHGGKVAIRWIQTVHVHPVTETVAIL